MKVVSGTCIHGEYTPATPEPPVVSWLRWLTNLVVATAFLAVITAPIHLSLIYGVNSVMNEGTFWFGLCKGFRTGFEVIGIALLLSIPLALGAGMDDVSRRSR